VTTFGTPPDDPQQRPAPPEPTEPAEPQREPPVGAGTLSPDGQWVWDGYHWTPNPAVPPPTPGYVPPSAYGPPGYGAHAGPPPPGYPHPGYSRYGPASRGPAPGLAYAGFGIRLAAFLLDVLIFIVPFITFLTVAVAYANEYDSRNDVGVAIGVIGLVFTAVVLLAYQILLPASGGTWGMRALRLRVARADNGANIGYTLSLGRWLIFAAMSVVPPGQILDALWVCFDERKQALHDKAVDTLVVRPLV